MPELTDFFRLSRQLYCAVLSFSLLSGSALADDTTTKSVMRELRHSIETLLPLSFKPAKFY